MSDTTISLCGNILLKPVKMHFSANTEILGVKKVHLFFHGGQSSFLLKIGTLEIVKNRLSPKRK